MASLPGRCTNKLVCSLAASGEIVRIADGQAYVCPVCGRGLSGPLPPRRWPRPPAAVIIWLVASVALAYIIGFVIGRVLVRPLSHPVAAAPANRPSPDLAPHYPR